MIRFPLQYLHHTGSALSVFTGCQDLHSVLFGNLDDALIRPNLKGQVHVGDLYLECVV